MKAHRYLEEAEQEFQEHIDYFDRISRTVASRFVDEIEAAVTEIRRHPQVGTSMSRSVRKRVLTGFKYSIDTPDEIIIVAVAPHRRRPGYWAETSETTGSLTRVSAT